MTRRAGLLLLGIAALLILGGSATAQAAQTAQRSRTGSPPVSVLAAVPGAEPGVTVRAPVPPSPPAVPAGGSVSVNVNNGPNGKPSTSITLLIALTVLSVAPSLLLLCTCFTKVFVVLSIVRNAIGLTTVPPNQVLAGLALFLSLFIMSPVVSQVNSQGVQPYLKGTKNQTEAFNDGIKPLRAFMIKHTRRDEIGLMTKVAQKPKPKNAQNVPLTTLIPAFILSELRGAFIIGFVIYLPFIVIDMVVAASLMSLGMMMLPPVTVSLPFKLLLFVMANGWGLVITSLVASYR